MSPPPDIYDHGVDFVALALQYPDFAKKLKRNGQLDFSDPESVRDFNLKIDLPDDRLCPPVPNRFNYILFAQRLLDTTRSDYGDGYDENRRVIGLDIGTGASAIYPLLACQSRPSWLFLATEIDEKSRDYAQRNIAMNSLSSRIKVQDTDLSGNVLIPSKELQHFDSIDILLTNPPFYASAQELASLAQKKSRPPNSACTGASVEMIYKPSSTTSSDFKNDYSMEEGGEVGFVSRLVTESLDRRLKTRIKWCSSMLGKLSSVSIIIEKLREIGCTNYVVNEFVNKKEKGKTSTSTRRWVVAWSWCTLRPSNDVARGTDAVMKSLLPSVTTYETVLDGMEDEAGSKVDKVITTLENENDEVDWRWKANMHTGVGRSMQGDVWSRAARRRKAKKEDLSRSSKDISNVNEMRIDTEESDENEQRPAFVFKINLEPSNTQGTFSTKIVVRWLQGQDPKIFESFCGWLKRKLREE